MTTTEVHRGHIYHIAAVRRSPSRLGSRRDTAGRVGHRKRRDHLLGDKDAFPRPPSGPGRRPRIGIFVSRLRRRPHPLPAGIRVRRLRRRPTAGLARLLHLPSEALFSDPEFAQHAAIEFCNRRLAAGTAAAMASVHRSAQDALFSEPPRRGSGSPRPGGPDRHFGAAPPLVTSGRRRHPAHRRRDRQMARRRHRRPKTALLPVGHRPAVLPVDHRRNIQSPWQAL